jgi:hypothetical protein
MGWDLGIRPHTTRAIRESRSIGWLLGGAGNTRRVCRERGRVGEPDDGVLDEQIGSAPRLIRIARNPAVGPHESGFRERDAGRGARVRCRLMARIQACRPLWTQDRRGRGDRFCSVRACWCLSVRRVPPRVAAITPCLETPCRQQARRSDRRPQARDPRPLDRERHALRLLSALAGEAPRSPLRTKTITGVPDRCSLVA